MYTTLRIVSTAAAVATPFAYFTADAATTLRLFAVLLGATLATNTARDLRAK